MSPPLAVIDRVALTSGLMLTPLQLSGDFLQFVIVFFVLAIVAALVGARGVAGISMQIAKWFVIIFVVLAVISLVL